MPAHARALPAMEAIITANPALPRTHARTPLLAADLATLRQAMPASPGFAGARDGASAWGILYVIEGSRLGGGILAGRVGRDLPAAYLGARHRSGEWRGIGDALNTEAARNDEAWIDRAVAAADACFERYARAASSA